MSLYYYNEFGLNIPKYMTLPSLAMSVFRFNFYDEKYQIKLIKGPLEKYILENLILMEMLELMLMKLMV